jgi:myo-inositol-1(or 4)-monophosphatase
VAAGAFIVEKAGGKISDFSGGAGWLTGGQILATNSLIHVEFLEALKNAGL